MQVTSHASLLNPPRTRQTGETGNILRCEVGLYIEIQPTSWWAEVGTKGLTLLSPPIGGLGFLGGVATPDSG